MLVIQPRFWAHQGRLALTLRHASWRALSARLRAQATSRLPKALDFACSILSVSAGAVMIVGLAVVTPQIYPNS
jgi:hypothetical protein